MKIATIINTIIRSATLVKTNDVLKFVKAVVRRLARIRLSKVM